MTLTLTNSRGDVIREWDITDVNDFEPDEVEDAIRDETSGGDPDDWDDDDDWGSDDEEPDDE